MKDLCNFGITYVEKGGKVQYTLYHKKNLDMKITFQSAEVIKSKHIPKFMEDVFKAWVNKYFSKSRRAMTGKQEKFYEKLVEFHRTEGRPPTLEEQCRFFGFKSRGTPLLYIRNLAARGWVWIDRHGKAWPIDIVAPDQID